MRPTYPAAARKGKSGYPELIPEGIYLRAKFRVGEHENPYFDFCWFRHVQRLLKDFGACFISAFLS
jgi:hypothetical protein